MFEFVALSSAKLPIEQVDLAEDRLHLWRCPPVEPLQNEVVYDGWYDLSGPDPGEARRAFVVVSQALNRLSFAFDSSLQWRPKYTSVFSAGSYTMVDDADLKVLDGYLARRSSEEENAVLDSAIDWYSRARVATNAFTRFLSYYIPLEVVALAVGSSEAAFGIETPKLPPSERRRTRRLCVESLHEEVYAADPAEFVRRSYFECIGSIRKHVESTLAAVFGGDAPEVRAVVAEGEHELSLMALRSKIAHGDYSFANEEHLRTVEGRTPELAAIVRAFISRLALNLSPTDRLPSRPGMGRAGIAFDDPRNLQMVTSDALQSRDWRIRPRWCV